MADSIVAEYFRRNGRSGVLPGGDGSATIKDDSSIDEGGTSLTDSLEVLAKEGKRTVVKESGKGQRAKKKSHQLTQHLYKLKQC